MPENHNNPVLACEHRQDVQVRFNDGRVFCAPAGTRLESFIKKACPPPNVPVVGARVNGRIAELSEPLIADVDVEPISMATDDGMRMYHRGLTMLLEVVARELFNACIEVDHSLTFGGLFCRVRARAPFTDKEIAQIEDRMRVLVAENLPITRETIPIAEVIANAQAQDDDAQVLLLKQTNRKEVRVHVLRGVKHYFLGRMMVPSTGYLKHFRVQSYPPGFVLQFPRRTRPTALDPIQHSPKISAVFREYGDWLTRLGISDAGALNQDILEGHAREIVLVAEALHAQRIAEIASTIAQHRERVRLITIAGPSSSGKTTFARRLTIQLLANGVRPFPLSLDDYFLAREDTPRNSNGEYDYENLRALDLDLFDLQLVALVNGEKVTLPRYNFETGNRETGNTVQLTLNHVLLIEGIHGLNPNLVNQVPPDRIFRIYISALTQMNLDRLNRVSTSDTRLMRRIVRDARTRGYSARETIAHWENVRQGEDRNIFPYQEQADTLFNSALVYEMSVLKSLAEPLLRQVEPGTAEYVEARRLLTFLEWFKPADAAFVPEDSILREFIGGSVLTDFVPHL
jgi:uridine kinase